MLCVRLGLGLQGLTSDASSLSSTEDLVQAPTWVVLSIRLWLTWPRPHPARQRTLIDKP